MKTFGKYTVLCTALLSTLFIMSGCDNLLSPPETPKWGTQNPNAGTLVLSIGRGSGRTIMPSTGLDAFVRFDLNFTALTPGNTSFNRTWTALEGAIELSAGDWELTVKAYLNENGNVVEAARKTETITVTAGALVIYSIGLEPIVAGTGTFSWTIKYSGGVTEAIMEIIPLDENGEPDTANIQTFSLVSEEADSITLDAGQYRVLFTFKKGVDHEAVISETLHIYQNMDSPYTRIFKDSIFPIGLLKTIEEVEEYLEAADWGAAVDDPVYLPIALVNGIGDMQTGSGWLLLLAAIDNAKKYVEVDLSVCSMNGSKFTDNGFYDKKGKAYIVSLILPNAAQSVSGYMDYYSCFSYFTNLQFIRGDNISTIIRNAISGCTELVSVDFPAVTTIREKAFYDCINLASFDFPEVTSIDDSAFSGCASITSVNFPKITSIGDSVFSGCTNLSSVNIPSVMNIADNAFNNTGTNELTITLGDTAPELGATIFSNVPRTVRVQTPRNAEGYVENWVNNLCTGTSDVNVVLPWVTLIYTPDLPVLRLGGAVSLAAPKVALAEDISISGQGWQICDNGTWGNFIPPQRAVMDLNEKDVRYYIATDDGIMSYSNTTAISVLSEYSRDVTVHMWDSYGDGWNSNAALRIEVNGTFLKNVQLHSGRQGYNTFAVNTGDVVKFYWVQSSNLDRECAFVVYYSDEPPSPAFDPSYGTTDTSRVLLYKCYTNPYLSFVDNGTLMGSFGVSLLSGIIIKGPLAHENRALSLASPIAANGTSLTGPGWQISDNGSSGWQNFTPPSTASLSLNGKYLRYSTNTESSNIVKIAVIPVNPEITVQMWDSADNGWSSALRVTVNGNDRLNIKLNSGGSGSQTFSVNTGDTVGFYWSGSSASDSECAFVAYYSAAPPSPVFDPLNGTTDEAKVLVSKRYNNPSGSVGSGTLFGWFPVGYGVFVNTLYEPSRPVENAAFSYPATPGVIYEGVTITSQGWEISSDSSGSSWSRTIPSTATRSLNYRKLRYYFETNEGTTHYSNTVTILVRTSRKVTVKMYSKKLLGGWDVLSNGYMYITVNGNNRTTLRLGALKHQDDHEFYVLSGDSMSIGWSCGIENGFFDYDCAFVVYYSDKDVSFNPEISTTPSNTLTYMKYQTFGTRNSSFSRYFTAPYYPYP